MRSPISFLLSFLLPLVLPSGNHRARAQESAAPGTWLVQDVDVLTMEDDALLRHRDVHVAGGSIHAVVPTGTLAVAPGTGVVDGRGLTVLPGLMDLHVHLNDEEDARSLWMYLAAGVTTVQSMHGSPRHLEVRRQIAGGELLGPRFLTTGPTTATENVDSPGKARSVVAAQADAGYDAIKMYGDGNNTMTRATYRAVIEAAHARGLRVVGHAPRNLPFDEVLAAGQDSIDHLEEVVYTAVPILDVYGPLVRFQFGDGQRGEAERLLGREDLDPEVHAAVQEVASAIAATDLALTPTLVAFATIQAHCSDAFDLLLQPGPHECLSPLTRRRWSPRHNRYRTAWNGRYEIMERVLGAELDVQKRLVRACHERGVPLMTGSDAPLPFVYPGHSVHRELELFVECGLSPYEALRAATTVPASALRIADRVGTVTAGKEADLLLVRGDPTGDISRVRDVAGIFVRGRWLDAIDLEMLLDELRDLHADLDAQVELVSPALDRGDALAALEAFAALDSPDPRLAALVEDECNSLGYTELRRPAIESAIEIFARIRDTFPDSWNAWDSLGEAYLSQGDRGRARECYQRSVELNPDSRTGRDALRRMGGG